MRERTIVHVAGPTGAGKTTFTERLLDAQVALAHCVRGERDPTVPQEEESAPRAHPELRRYLRAGASDVALFRFAAPSMDEFFISEIMQNYSEAVFIEGDCPLACVDLSVFVSPPPTAGRSLLRRIVREHATAHQAAIGQFAQALESSEGLVRLLSAGLGEPLAAMVLKQPRRLEDLRRSLEAGLSEIRHAPPPAATEHWALGAGYDGIERAQLVVINVRSENDRLAAQLLIDDVARLRKDEAIFRDVIGYRGHKLPVTAVMADLSVPKDPGLKKAVARVKRAAKRRMP